METMQQVSAGVRVLLRRVNDTKLHSDDIREQLCNLLRGYSRDLNVSERDRKTTVIDVEIQEDDIDYILNFDLQDSEVEKLEYGADAGAGAIAWSEVDIVDLSAFARHFDQPYVAAAFYGDGNLKLNINPETAAGLVWQLTYRESMLQSVASNARVPLPGDFIPMLTKEGAVLCMPLVRDDSPEWVGWMERTIPMYETTILEWNNPGFKHNGRAPGRWQHYVMSSSEPQIQNIQPFNQFRRRRPRVRGYLPVQ